MRLAITRLSFSWAILIMSGCALPPAQVTQTPFVRSKELQVVNLLREGVDYANRSRYVDAEFSFRQALYLDPHALNAKVNLASVLEKLEEFDEAISILKGTLPSMEASFKRIFARQSMNKPIAGITVSVVQQANEISIAEVYTFLGRVLQSANRNKEAEAAFKQALSLAEDLQDSKNAVIAARSLSALLFRLGDEDSALCNAQLAVNYAPDSTNQVRLAKLLTGIGAYERAALGLSTFASAQNKEKEPEVLAAMANAQFGREKFAEVIKLIQLQKDLAGKDNPAENETTVLLAFASASLQTAGKELPQGVTVDDSQKNLREAGDSRSSAVTIFWPANLVSQFLDFDFSDPEEGK